MSGFGTEQAVQETQMSALSEERKLVRGSFFVNLSTFTQLCLLNN